MNRIKTGWLLAGVLSLLLWPAFTASQETSWEKYMEAAGKAYQQADYVKAEKLVKAALREAEKFGEQDPRFATSLNNLALLYDNQSKYAEAEPLYRRALFVLTKALGPDHPNVATTLENYAVLLRKMDRDNEAEKMEARAQAIRIVHALKNPKK